MRLALLALVALLFAIPAYADDLQVTMTVPFFINAATENITTSFDWNTATDVISNVVTTGGGFTFDGVGSFDPVTGGIQSMIWTDALGSYFEQDPEYEIGTNGEILPSPGTYGIEIYEYCSAEECGTPFPQVSTTGAFPVVSTPEPSTLLLLGIGVLGLTMMSRLRAS